MKTDELREKYLTFFQSKGHSRQPSDVLVPTWDPSVLFTPAGMNQFKDHFLGKVKLDFTRATTCQKCLRTGDIDNVGRTAYHHTFFEMLGNFSFGDYFKHEAIEWAWEFLTSSKWLGIVPDRLTVTVYKDDDEAANIWHDKIGLPTTRIARMEEDENFWPASAPSQGPDGVCGPCSEIYYKLDNGKSVEIWNLVFTQFNRVGDPPDNLRALPSKNIDTGMGLERTASVLQNVPSNFHIDILFPIVKAASEVCSTKYEYDSDAGRRLRRITDHVRACTFAIHENVIPGPKKARYVIKRLLRRAVLDGHQLGMRDAFLHQLVPVVAQAMKSTYPELSETIQRVSDVIRREEKDFFSTIDAGLERMEKVFQTMSGSGAVTVDGREAASLYQTYGVPPELFQAIAAERNLAFDWDGYRDAMREHEIISDQRANKDVFQTGPLESLKAALRRTDFVGYESSEIKAEVKGIIVDDGDDGRAVAKLPASDAVVRVVLDKTPFYGEGGGQVGDTGMLEADGVLFKVENTQKSGELFVHSGQLVRGELREGMSVAAKVDGQRRGGIKRAHSATHILHHALQSVLGGHAQQQGSKVDQDWLRFDFTNQQPLSDEQIEKIEDIVADRVRRAEPISWKLVPLGEARKAGAMMLFGEKYPDPVRMVSMGEFSKELCGGTHLNNTSEVQQFEIMSEENVSAGTRRIVALTGQRADEHRKQVQEILSTAAKKFSCAPTEVAERVRQLVVNVRSLKKQLSAGGSVSQPAVTGTAAASHAAGDYRAQRAALRDTARLLNVSTTDVLARLETLFDEFHKLNEQVGSLASIKDVSADTLMDQAETVSGTMVIVSETPGASPNLMRQWIDQVRQKSSTPVAMLLASRTPDDKVMLVAGLSRALVDKGLSAGTWISRVAPIVGGGGGGKPDLAQAGGKLPEKISEAIVTARESIAEMLA